MKLYKKILYAISWIPVAIFHIITILLGLIVVPYCLMAIGKSGTDYEWPDFFWLWYNDEEGCPEWWLVRATNMNWFIKRFPRFWWFAVRNPVNNFRYIFEDRMPIQRESNWGPLKPMEASNMLARGQQMAYRWVANKWFSGYRRVWLKGITHYSEIWIGWKIGSNVPGMGFTLQIRLNRKIGT